MKRQEHAVSMLTQKEKYYLNIPVFVYFDFFYYFSQRNHNPFQNLRRGVRRGEVLRGVCDGSEDTEPEGRVGTCD